MSDDSSFDKRIGVAFLERESNALNPEGNALKSPLSPPAAEAAEGITPVASNADAMPADKNTAELCQRAREVLEAVKDHCDVPEHVRNTLKSVSMRSKLEPHEVENVLKAVQVAENVQREDEGKKLQQNLFSGLEGLVKAAGLSEVVGLGLFPVKDMRDDQLTGWEAIKASATPNMAEMGPSLGFGSKV